MDTSKFSNLPVDQEVVVYNNRTYTFNQSELTWYASNVQQPFDPSFVDVQTYGSGILIVTNREDINNDVLWEQIRNIRDEKISQLDWKYNRYWRLNRLGLNQIDDLIKLDTYAQALADITKQNDPRNIIWPIL